MVDLSRAPLFKLRAVLSKKAAALDKAELAVVSPLKSGYRPVTALYYNPATGRLRVEYDDGEN